MHWVVRGIGLRLHNVAHAVPAEVLLTVVQHLVERAAIGEVPAIELLAGIMMICVQSQLSSGIRGESR
jgi:hypothetical protein